MAGRIPEDANNNHLILKDLINGLVKKGSIHQEKFIKQLISETRIARSTIFRLLSDNTGYTHITNDEMKKAIKIAESKYNAICKTIIKSKRIT